MAANQTSLFLDDEAGDQLIHELSKETADSIRSFPSAITGGNRGLSYLNGSVFHMGVHDGAVGFSQHDEVSGVFRGHQPLTDAIESNDAASDGQRLLFTASDGDSLRLFVVTELGTEVCSQLLDPLSESTGLASSGSRLYVHSSLTREIFVFGSK